jgi:hypothetical protein
MVRSDGDVGVKIDVCGFGGLGKGQQNSRRWVLYSVFCLVAIAA